MLARRCGGVMVVTSTGGFYATPKLAVYGATKAFLLSFTEALSEELRGTGVHALALCPGATASEFGEVAGMQSVMEKAPLMSPEAVATAALRAWDRKAVICVPGGSNKFMVQAAQFLPRAVTRRAISALFN